MQDVAGKQFDVIVVGSGASGGWAAKRLSEAGLNVALLDAGRRLTDADYSEHKPSFQLSYRNRNEVVRKSRFRQADCYACQEYNYDWFVNDLDEPYTTAPGMPFSWQGRLRVVGGRTNVWGRQSYRLSDLDFKAASHDGHGVDWPLAYADLAPFYDIVEDYVGISGQPEGIDVLPDGRLQPPMGMTCLESGVRDRIKQKLGWTMTMGRVANLTKGVNGRQPCHYCGPCERGCVTHSYFNSAFTTVADAIATKRCTLVPNAMAYQVLTDTSTSRARGVLYVDRETRQPKEVFARAVVLCAQALESTRILLNSKGPRHPNGLANLSGVLGKYLMDHVMSGWMFAEFPGFTAKPSVNGPVRPNGTYVIRFRNLKGGPPSKDFRRGYGYQGGGGQGIFNFSAPGFGDAYKQAVLKGGGELTFGLIGFGESLAYEDNRVEIDPDVSDAFGIPVLRMHARHRDNEEAMLKDMEVSAAELLEAAGGRNVRIFHTENPFGWAIHEVGVARMGADAKTSVLNQFQQAWDVPNLFVMDGASFPSSACQNPTLTIMALAVRSCDYLKDRLRKGEL
jgi:choline dehydrogenase-like flavoprotein